MIFYLLAFIILTIILWSLLCSSKRRPTYKDKVVIITGASSGIGEELAYIYAKLGAKLVLAARRKDRLSILLDKCKSLGASDVITKVTDVSKEEDCLSLIQTTIQKFQVIDVLILNAGIGCLIKVADLKDISPYKQVMDINYWGCVFPTFYALDHLRSSKGTIIIVSSLSALFPTPKRAGYSASKKAIHGFFDCLRVEEPNIQITIVCPGFVKTEIHERALTEGQNLERNLDKFMNAETCAKLIYEAAAEKKRLEILTAIAKFGFYLMPFFPSFIENSGKKKAEDSFIKKSED